MLYVNEKACHSDNYVLLELVEEQRFGVEYQPIIDTLNGNVIGYEALARFFSKDGRSIPPLEIFQALHDSPLMLAQTELQLKRLQLRFRPQNLPLFLNLDPHAYSVFSQDNRGNAMVDMLSGHQNLVIEIIENTDVNDARISNELSLVMHKEGFAIALDDVGAPGTMVSLNILSDVDFIKFDRSWLKTNPNSNMHLLLKSMINYARVSGKKTVLEGVETAEDLATAVNLGIDYVQGFFYKELFITETCYG
ncbi:EAL domain-containing protein [Neptuniibacter caesariensis]|uniref:EAL domain-containing protein n=1 Tax=Neptuniibacter caesariensis TaxID=207954 RepID=UPI00138A2869|nr:EAL domain-containing protein [Neptuniibacter caesariensis]